MSLDIFLVASLSVGCISPLQKFLSGGGDPNTRWDAGVPLIAIATTCHRAVSALVEAGAAVAAADDAGRTALHYAAQQNHTRSISILLEAGADVNAKSNIGWTPLMLAAFAGKLGAVRLLVESGAYIDDKSSIDKWTAVDYAKLRGKIRVVEYLESVLESRPEVKKALD